MDMFVALLSSGQRTSLDYKASWFVSLSLLKIGFSG